MKYIDLHSHSTCSDGTHTPSELLTMAQEHELSVYSITDHGSVDAYDEVIKNRHLFSGKVLTGSELGFHYEGYTAEMLCYGCDISKLSDHINSRPTPSTYDMLRLCTDTYQKRGIKIGKEYLEKVETDPESLKVKFGDIRAPLLDEIKKYPENQKFFEDKFEDIDRHIFLRKYFSNRKSPLFIDRTVFLDTLEVLCDVVHNAGGLAFLAHPFIYNKNIIEKLDYIAKYIDGIECYYGFFTKDQIKFLCDYCDEKGLYKSGGSDFHDEVMRPKNVFGISCGKRISYDIIEPWIDKVKLI